jgi:hypothetical protein
LLQNVFEVDLDIKQKTAIKMPTVTQNDTVVFVCRIFDDGRIYNIQSGATFTMTATRPDKVTVITEGAVTDENIVEFTLGTTELAVAGKVNTVVQVYDAEGRISTIPFGYYVLNDPSTDYIPSEHEETLIERVLGDGPQVIDDAEQAGDYAQSVADENKTTWLTPVATYEDITTTYIEPNHGDTVMTHTDGKIYRYFNGTWNHTQTYTDSALTSIQNQLSEQKQQDKVLVHGLNVLSSDQASPLKVEFYGNTLVNLLGRDGNFEKDLINYGGYSGDVRSLVTTNAVYGTKCVEINRTDVNAQISNALLRRSIDNEIQVGKYYIASVYVKNTSSSGIYLNYEEAGLGNKNSTTINAGESKEVYVKFTKQSGATVYYLDVHATTDGAIGKVYIDGLRLYEISQSTYDKIGVSLTDADIERMFPYVDSVQHVRNPYVKVSGENLFNPNNFELELDGSEIIASNEYKIEGDGRAKGGEWKGTLVKGQTYTVSFEYKIPKQLNYYQYSHFTVFVNGVAKFERKPKPIRESYTQTSFQFTAIEGENTIRFSVYDNADFVYVLEPQIELGDKDTSYVPYNPSYLYAYQVNETGENEPLILAGSDDKKDISWESQGKWYKTKWFETDEVLTVTTGTSTLAKAPVIGTIDIEDSANGDIVTDFTVSGQTITWGATVPTSPVAHYQLQNKETEEITVTGDLSIQGDAQIEVSSGFDVTTNEDGEKEFTMWTDRSGTANLTEVVAHYQNSIKSSIQSVVTDLSDAKTTLSIHAKQIYDLLVKTRNL